MLPLFTIFLIAVAVYASTPDRASNFPVSPDVAAQYECGSTCQENIQAASATDLEDFDMPFDFDFYTTAKNFSGSKPGDILKLQPVDPKLAKFPAGIAAYRFQYTSVDLDNSTIPATAFIAFPFVRQKDPFKLVAYAHGTSGVFRGCSPSTSSTFYDYDTWIPLSLAGYAVVGTDYAGLGNNYSAHKYISARVNANDVFWSTIAAQNAFPHSLSREWVSIGHSQGGGASWKLSEHKLVQKNQSGYLGGVAIAPNTRIYDAITQSVNMAAGLSSEDQQKMGSSGYIPSIYFALRAVYPNYTAPFLSTLAKKRFELGELAQLCAAALPAVVSDLGLAEIITSLDEDALSVVKEFQELNAPAQGDKASRPLLVIQGANDTTVFPSLTVKAYEQACEAGNRVRLSIYPGLEHSPLSGASAPQWLEFIDGLFEGRDLHNCSVETVSAFDLEYARTPAEDEL
ncbi:alpha/beta-hydrolase [Macroventuria anomochaeta]|uniref:Alpha/beta-hydrolase n=1 Tax=Macroventuria anomochaeta TaxID=301207 RepID=A0ACB6S5H1_9PLEO|nr:alpha/beta-hydrolase [Macroventuria anomochaeta]KAF2629490.1 alpha/beta-hydrolase [Macroventuria anomochaeta]